MNIILVSRPINFFYAIELCKKHEQEQFLILVFPNPASSEVKAIEFLTSEFAGDLPNAQFVRFSSLLAKDILNLVLFKWYLKLKFIGKKFKMLSTSGGVKGRLTFKHLHFKEIILTDEGLGTSYSRFPEIAETNRLFRRPTSKLYKRMYKLLGVENLKNKDNYTIYTMYDELVKYSPKIHHNRFEHFKELLDRRQIVLDEKEIIVVGSSPLRRMFCNEIEYKEMVVKIFEDYKEYRVRLKPHKLYNKTYGLETIETDLAIESYFIKRNKIPGKMISFGSTANKLVSYLFPQIEVINITSLAMVLGEGHSKS